MIVIQLAGGLGNQMFQYALCLQLKSLGKDVRIDDVAGFEQDAKRDPVLGLFGISYERASNKELRKMLDSSPLIWHKVRRRLFGRKKKAYFEEDKRYHPEIMSWDDIYLEGYWQTEKYFESISDQVKQVFDMDRLLENAAKNHSAGDGIINAEQMSVEYWMARIASTESVGVHIRRGDYLLPENQDLFGGICTASYYREAMEQMKREHPDCRFYLFTNDKQWVQEQISAERQTDMENAENADTEWTNNIEVVDLGQQSDYAEFVLMSRCKHQIMANSSFSWWASYLNRNQGKIVLAPDRWLNGWDCRDIYRKDMQRVTATKGISAT